jgi:hypothetical protein
MTDCKVALVVASNREAEFLQFLESWCGKGSFPWDTTILVQDGPGPRFRPDDGADEDPEDPAYSTWKELIHEDWGSIGASADCNFSLPPWLSRRDSGIKSWGFARAVLRENADVVITLDDDCLPSNLGAYPARYRSSNVDCDELVESARLSFVQLHLDALFRTSKWGTSVPGFVPRGLPYGEPGPPFYADCLPVMINMGVWQINPDRDSVHELTNRTPENDYKAWIPQKSLYRHTRVMPATQYWPMSGMNLAFRREATPLMYFPRMGEGTPFRRFDDIWAGVIAQKVCGHLGWAMAVGRPIVRHMRASRPMDNLVRESPGIRANEEFWRVIDRIPLDPGMTTPLLCLGWIGESLARLDLATVHDPLLQDYLPPLGDWIRQWCNLFWKEGWQ